MRILSTLIHPERILRLALKAYQVWLSEGMQGVKRRIQQRIPQKKINQYGKWVKKYDTLRNSDRKAISAQIEGLRYKPLISVVMPVYNVEERWLRSAVESVRNQLYPHWELCIADDNSSASHVKSVLEQYAAVDPRIKVIFRKKNGHISAASNSALSLVSGEFVALVDHDDEIPEHALYMVVEELNAHPEADLIYSDEDKIDIKGQRYEPYFKPDWNRDLFYSLNCISHFGVYRTSIVKKIGGFRQGYEGSQDYDLALRVVEQIPAYHIRHIPHILYHWRSIPGSVALSGDQKEYAHDAARKAIQSHLERTGINAKVTAGYGHAHRVIYPIASFPLVSLIISVRGHVNLLRQLVEGIYEQTDYRPIELIIINECTEPDALAYIHEIQEGYPVKVVNRDSVTSYSAMINSTVQQAEGEIVGLISSDIRVISREWLKEMVSHATRPDIGAVGAKLYSLNHSIQHAGLILCADEIAVHVHRSPAKLAGIYHALPQLIQAYSCVSADCLVMRKQVFNEVKGFDEVNLPTAFSDIALCLRIREHGYRILWTPYAELSRLTPVEQKLDDTSEWLQSPQEERNYIKSRWGPLLHSDPCHNPNLSLKDGSISLAFPPRASKPWRM